VLTCRGFDALALTLGVMDGRLDDDIDVMVPASVAAALQPKSRSGASPRRDGHGDRTVDRLDPHPAAHRRPAKTDLSFRVYVAVSSLAVGFGGRTRRSPAHRRSYNPTEAPEHLGRVDFLKRAEKRHRAQGRGAVVAASLLRITEDLVRLGQPLKRLSFVATAALAVGMQLKGSATVGPLDLSLRRIPGDP
jgi:hypothetical protein